MCENEIFYRLYVFHIVILKKECIVFSGRIIGESVHDDKEATHNESDSSDDYGWMLEIQNSLEGMLYFYFVFTELSLPCAKSFQVNNVFYNCNILIML